MPYDTSGDDRPDQDPYEKLYEAIKMVQERTLTALRISADIMISMQNRLTMLEDSVTALEKQLAEKEKAQSGEERA